MPGVLSRPLVVVLLSLAAVAAAAPTALANQFPGLASPNDRDKVIRVNAQFVAPEADRPALLFVTAEIDRGWHIYSITQEKKGPIPTTIRLSESDDYQLAGDFRASPPPQSKVDQVAWPGLKIESHEGKVTWYAPLELAPSADLANLNISGKVNAQACTDESCLPPANFAFEARLADTPPIRIDEDDEEQDLAVAPAASVPPTTPQKLDFAQLQIDDDGAANLSMPVAILFGFLGGLILNLMPCVLPVIGLKLLAFVEQSGNRRDQVFLLNLWYALGLMSVFMLLAGLAVFAGIGWGQLFSYSGFQIFMAAIVFTMGLSFLGVWEIPIPGFVGGNKAHQIASQEGAGGAFAKGVLTTILATPCSGPFLGSALVWATAQPPFMTVATFFSIGLGMASPYLLIGAFPRLIHFLPRPGAWMDTLKQVMGFVLLGTVVFLFTFMSWQHMVPTLALLFGLWAACWWIGRTPLTADFGTKTRTWVEAGAFALAVGFVSFTWLADVMASRFEMRIDREISTRQMLAAQGPAPAAAEALADATNHLPWQPFSREKLDELTANNQTVLVDFTADWCLTCKTLEATVLNTTRTREVIDANNIVTLQADWTDGDQEITDVLKALGSAQVPTVAIFPAGRPNEPIVFRGSYTRTSLFEGFRKAGANIPGSESATAMRP